MKSDNKIIQWFKNNWFLWIILIVFYVGIRIAGYDVQITKSKTQPTTNLPQTKRPPLSSYEH